MSNDFVDKLAKLRAVQVQSLIVRDNSVKQYKESVTDNIYKTLFTYFELRQNNGYIVISNDESLLSETDKEKYITDVINETLSSVIKLRDIVIGNEQIRIEFDNVDITPTDVETVTEKENIDRFNTFLSCHTEHVYNYIDNMIIKERIGHVSFGSVRKSYYKYDVNIDKKYIKAELDYIELTFKQRDCPIINIQFNNNEFIIIFNISDERKKINEFRQQVKVYYDYMIKNAPIGDYKITIPYFEKNDVGLMNIENEYICDHINIGDVARYERKNGQTTLYYKNKEKISIAQAILDRELLSRVCNIVNSTIHQTFKEKSELPTMIVIPSLLSQYDMNDLYLLDVEEDMIEKILSKNDIYTKRKFDYIELFDDKNYIRFQTYFV